MSNIKYRIGIGNCEPGVNESISKPVPTGTTPISTDMKFDSTVVTFDSTVITFDNA